MYVFLPLQITKYRTINWMYWLQLYQQQNTNVVTHPTFHHYQCTWFYFYSRPTELSHYRRAHDARLILTKIRGEIVDSADLIMSYFF